MDREDSEMVYGELEGEALAWATQAVFGLDPSSVPPKVVITPSKVEEYFQNIKAILRSKRLTLEKTGKSFIVRKDYSQALFCQGGVGASAFADSSYILCHRKNIEEIVFVGTGGEIGENVQSVDIVLPTSCIRLESSWRYYCNPKRRQKLT